MTQYYYEWSSAPFMWWSLPFFVPFHLVFLLLLLIPVVKILHKAGYSGWWALLLPFWPIGIWIFAFSRWPALRKASA